MKREFIRIATRKSLLAIQQAKYVEKKLQILYPECRTEIVPLITTGDRSFDNRDKSNFIKELELALIDRRVDIAVHSMKDVPLLLSDKLIIPVICKREDPRDVFVSNHWKNVKDLPKAARVGTMSLRRQAQIKALRPDLCLEPLHGNVDTRLKKLDMGEYDAIILAASGLIRLKLENRITDYLNYTECLPAAGQGAIGIECRAYDELTLTRIAALNHRPSEYCVRAERAMNKRLGSSCHTPVAAYASLVNQKITLRGLVSTLDGSLLLRAEETGSVNEAEQIGIRVAEQLLTQGAESILVKFRNSEAFVMDKKIKELEKGRKREKR